MAPINLDACIEQLLNKQLLHEALLREICEKTKEVLMRESNVVHVSAPVTVVGDIHGQFYDLVEIFRIGGYAPHTNYLFLGDYVDRGLFSVETISLLTCLKLRYPDRVQLIRGNHESRAVTQTYGFYTECVRKYGSARVWTYFTDMFDFLTLSVVIDDQIFCVHGGLSPSIHSIDQIKVVDRFREIPHEGPMADLVWSDPDPDKEDFAISPRGAGYTFGSGVVRKFLDMNGMTHILRAHQLCMEGFSVLFDNHLSTVWSAPNYCYRCGNSASILEVGPNNSMHFNVFEAAPENERDGPNQQQAAQNAGSKVSLVCRRRSGFLAVPYKVSSSATRVLFVKRFGAPGSGALTETDLLWTRDHMDVHLPNLLKPSLEDRDHSLVHPRVANDVNLKFSLSLRQAFRQSHAHENSIAASVERLLSILRSAVLLLVPEEIVGFRIVFLRRNPHSVSARDVVSIFGFHTQCAKGVLRVLQIGQRAGLTSL